MLFRNIAMDCHRSFHMICVNYIVLEFGSRAPVAVVTCARTRAMALSKVRKQDVMPGKSLRL